LDPAPRGGGEPLWHVVDVDLDARNLLAVAREGPTVGGIIGPTVGAIVAGDTGIIAPRLFTGDGLLFTRSRLSNDARYEEEGEHEKLHPLTLPPLVGWRQFFRGRCRA